MKEGNGLYHIIYWHLSKKKNETRLGFWYSGCNLILLEDPGICLEKLFLKGRYQSFTECQFLCEPYRFYVYKAPSKITQLILMVSCP